jgi:selenide, water dikinase
VIGGHSIQDQEIKFGYCVTGSVHPGRIWTNGGARSGDVLLLTKPVGTGIITTGVKYGKASAEVLEQAVVSMLQLNEKAARLLQERTVHAATDVTGFGLLGHAFEMSRASRVTLVLEAEAVPLLPGTRELAQRGMLPGGILTNRHYLGERVDWGNLPELLQNCFLDPQTSGGLLIAVSEEDSVEVCRQLVDSGITAARVGRVVEEEPGCSIRFQ